MKQVMKKLTEYDVTLAKCHLDNFHTIFVDDEGYILEVEDVLKEQKKKEGKENGTIKY